MVEKYGNKLQSLLSGEEALSRLQVVAGCAARLSRYQRDIRTFDRWRAVPAGAVASRAAGAENDCRILLKVWMDTLNDLRDSGHVDGIMVSGVVDSDDSVEVQFREGLTFLQRERPEALTGFDDQMIQEAVEILASMNLKMASPPTKSKRGQGDVVGMEFTAGGVSHRAVVSKRKPGDLGRIDSSSIFANGRRYSMEVRRTRNESLSAAPETRVRDLGRIDYYAYCVAGVAAALEEITLRTEIARYYGAPHIRGEAVVILVVIVVSAVAMLAGTVISIGCAEGWWSGKICDVGVALLVAGTFGALSSAVAGCYAKSQDPNDPGCEIQLNGAPVGNWHI